MRRFRNVQRFPHNLSAQSLGLNLLPSGVIPFNISRLKSTWLIACSLFLRQSMRANDARLFSVVNSRVLVQQVNQMPS